MAQEPTVLNNFSIHRDDSFIKLASQFFDSLFYNNFVLSPASITYTYNGTLDLIFTITALLHLLLFSSQLILSNSAVLLIFQTH